MGSKGCALGGVQRQSLWSGFGAEAPIFLVQAIALNKGRISIDPCANQAHGSVFASNDSVP